MGDSVEGSIKTFFNIQSQRGSVFPRFMEDLGARIWWGFGGPRPRKGYVFQ